MPENALMQTAHPLGVGPEFHCPTNFLWGFAMPACLSRYLLLCERKRSLLSGHMEEFLVS